jgi:uncharacterized protein YecE (DUF72 family)
MQILIGTSGFSYDDWRGHFYPKTIGKREMLSYYAESFSTVEVNSTYYALPHPATFVQMSAKVPPEFLFAVKAHRDMTHSGGELQPEAFETFRAALLPLQEQEMLGCVLAQFPWSFKPHLDNEEYLRALREELPNIPTVIEFRNAGWFSDRTLELLRALGLGFCCVDEPALPGLMPRVTAATSPIGYVRFHGRNAQKWWKHEHAYERYNYLYSEDELREWVPKIEQLAEATDRLFVFFNNHYEGKAGQNARMLAGLLNLTLPTMGAEDQAE